MFESGVKISERRMTNMRYTNDMTQMCGSREEMPKFLKGNIDVSERRGLLWEGKIPTTLNVRLLCATAFAVAAFEAESWVMKKS